MYQIQILDWDTNFFGYKIGKLVLTKNAEIEAAFFKTEDYNLIYIFSEHTLSDSNLKQIGAQLQDTKIEFIKKISLDKDYSISHNEVEIKPLSKLTDSLFHLVLESGLYSRFKGDKHFVNHEFERLYKAWIEKTLNDEQGKVIGAFVKDELIGFVSLSIKSGIADIGLIAVDEKARGKHIGKMLLYAAYNYAKMHKSIAITVVTQEKNIDAMHFYQNNGFEIDKKNYIYHLWKKKT
jgi:dTDP-4-amino-4,6-dideoxy-D-galactose acyltransferase